MAADKKFVYDLFSEIRRDPARAQLVRGSLDRLTRIQSDFENGKASREAVTKAMAEVIPASGYNFGLLMPHVFRSYPKELPLDFTKRPFMFAMTATAPGSVITFKAGRQVGKCVEGDTEVITENGPRTMKSIFDEGVSV